MQLRDSLGDYTLKHKALMSMLCSCGDLDNSATPGLDVNVMQLWSDHGDCTLQDKASMSSLYSFGVTMLTVLCNTWKRVFRFKFLESVVARSQDHKSSNLFNTRVLCLFSIDIFTTDQLHAEVQHP